MKTNIDTDRKTGEVKDAADSSYASDMPTAAGEYTVRAVIAETTNYLSCTVTADFTIAMATPTVTAPMAKTLTYTGSAQELVNAGSATGGTLYYAVTYREHGPDG